MTLSAVLLAGGESRRMGTDKAQIIFEGEPLWQRQIRTLRELRPEKLFVSARARPEWMPADVELILDEAPSRGPLSGITSTLQRMTTSHLVTLAIDMPFITSTELFSLIERVGTNRGVVPMIGERAEPLAAMYSKEAYVDCAAALSGNDHSLQSLIIQLAQAGKIALIDLSEDKSGRYRSINTPEDLNVLRL